jgi:DNA-binding PadR family transcriptional regulator
MSAQTTRMLVLGVVRIFGPANGYQLRRELLSWDVENWAHLNPGSIYSMLGTLEKDGLVARHDVTLDSGGRAVAVYTVTQAGVAEHDRMLLDALRTVPDPGDALPLRVALNFGPLLPRERYQEAIDARVAALDLAVSAIMAKERHLREPLRVPPHVLQELGLELALVRAQLGWLIEHAAEVRAGEMHFVGEDAPGDWGWTPPPDDPGWRMKAESEAYARKLGIARHGS